MVFIPEDVIMKLTFKRRDDLTNSVRQWHVFYSDARSCSCSEFTTFPYLYNMNTELERMSGYS